MGLCGCSESAYGSHVRAANAWTEAVQIKCLVVLASLAGMCASSTTGSTTTGATGQQPPPPNIPGFALISFPLSVLLAT